MTVDDGMRFVHASDLQGPASPVATAYLLGSARTSCTSGPPTYLQSQVGHDVVQRGSTTSYDWSGKRAAVIVDHHAVREPRFRERLAQAFDTGRIVTAAEYLGRRDECLEAWRAALWARRRRGRSDVRDATGGP